MESTHTEASASTVRRGILMPRGITRRVTFALAATAGLGSAAIAQSTAPAGPADGGPTWASVQQALGGKGAMQPGGVLKFGFPRTDLHVTVDGVALKPALALGSWVAFKRMGHGANASTMAMGDLVLTEDEVGPVMLALQQRRVQQTALHNHLLHELPRVMYMHIMAHGDAARIAVDIRAALGESHTPMPAATATASSDPMPASQAPAAPIDLDTAAVARALGAAGKVNGGVYQVSVPRAKRVMDHGMEVPPSMGVATAMNFQPTGGGRAAITGDFVMTADEVNPVILALREHGIQVTALHSHMLTESPRLFFMHFWANEDAVKLAGDLHAALDRMKVKR